MRHRRRIVTLAVLAVALGVGALLSVVTAADFLTRFDAYWQTSPTAGPGDADFDRIQTLSVVASMLTQGAPWLVLAATVPAIGALLLATLPGRPAQVAGSASATASRVASSAASVSAGSAESIS